MPHKSMVTLPLDVKWCEIILVYDARSCQFIIVCVVTKIICIHTLDKIHGNLTGSSHMSTAHAR